MKSRLLDQVRGVIRKRHLSIRTEHAYLQWIVRYIKFSGTVHPRDLSATDVSQFLSHLATDLQVSSTSGSAALSLSKGPLHPVVRSNIKSFFKG